MSDDQGILNLGVKQNLCDKSADKRKQAATDIEVNVRVALRFPFGRDVPAAVAAAVAATSAAGATGSVVGTSLGASSSSSGWEGGVEQVRRAIRCLADDYCNNANPNSRKGGLLGLASIAIALEHRPVQEHVSQLVPPVLTCFSDEEPSVRYSACEAFYNVAKVARHGILKEHLGPVFDGLCRLYADVDASVKDGAQCLDRLVRDIVTEYRDFKYSDFIPMLTTRIRVLNPSVLQLVLGWIVLLDSVPQVDMIVYLPQYLEGLFNILRSDNRDIRRNTELCLANLLSEIQSSARERPARAQHAIAAAAQMVARCCRAGEWGSQDEIVRIRALHWLLEFVKLQVQLEGIASSEDLERYPSPALDASVAVAPPLGRRSHVRASSHDGKVPMATASLTTSATVSNSCSSTAPAVGLRQLLPVLLSGALHCLDDGGLDDGEGEFLKNAELANDHLRRAAQVLGSDLPVEAVVDAVLGAMEKGVGGLERSSALILKCLGWAQLLFAQCPQRVLQPVVRDRLIEAALAALARPEDAVAIAALQLIAHLVTPGEDGLSSVGKLVGPMTSGQSGDGCAAAEAPEAKPCDNATGSDLFAWTCHRIFRLMAEDSTVLSGRCELVVRKLCEGVRKQDQATSAIVHIDDSERFFSMAARAVAKEEDLVFARRLVRVLNRVLLTSCETRALRARLRADALAAPRPGAAALPPASGAAAAAGAGADGGVGAGGQVPGHLVELLCSWFHCPVSTLALCLWLHWFELAAEIAARLAGMELTPELQQQLRGLVELLESPIFVRVRLDLLKTRGRPALLRTILGLVALQPQEAALRARLQVVETALLLDRATAGGAPPSSAAAAAAAAAGGKASASRHSFGAAGRVPWALSRFDAVRAAHGRRPRAL